MAEIPLLSVCLITYNHEKYIRQALDGIFMQEIDFPMEVIIADDFSTDNTRNIILEYKEKFGEVIRLIFQEKNVGAAKNFDVLIKTPKSKYIAYLEGDDYWTDPLKLQKQVCFLEENKIYGSCFHKYLEYFENINEFAEISKPILSFPSNEIGYLILDDGYFFKGWYTQLLTIVFRKNLLGDIRINDFKTYKDNHFVYFLLKQKPAVCFNWCGAVYRKHTNGVYSGISHKKNYIDHYFMYEELLSKTNDNRFYKLCENMIDELLKNYNLNELQDIFCKIKINYFKNKIILSYSKPEKWQFIKQVSNKEKIYIIKELIKRISNAKI